MEGVFPAIVCVVTIDKVEEELFVSVFATVDDLVTDDDVVNVVVVMVVIDEDTDVDEDLVTVEIDEVVVTVDTVDIVEVVVTVVTVIELVETVDVVVVTLLIIHSSSTDGSPVILYPTPPLVLLSDRYQL